MAGDGQEIASLKVKLVYENDQQSLNAELDKAARRGSVTAGNGAGGSGTPAPSGANVSPAAMAAQPGVRHPAHIQQMINAPIGSNPFGNFVTGAGRTPSGAAVSPGAAAALQAQNPALVAAAQQAITGQPIGNPVVANRQAVALHTFGQTITNQQNAQWQAANQLAQQANMAPGGVNGPPGGIPAPAPGGAGGAGGGVAGAGIPVINRLAARQGRGFNVPPHFAMQAMFGMWEVGQAATAMSKAERAGIGKTPGQQLDFADQAIGRITGGILGSTVGLLGEVAENGRDPNAGMLSKVGRFAADRLTFGYASEIADRTFAYEEARRGAYRSIGQTAARGEAIEGILKTQSSVRSAGMSGFAGQVASLQDTFAYQFGATNEDGEVGLGASAYGRTLMNNPDLTNADRSSMLKKARAAAESLLGAQLDALTKEAGRANLAAADRLDTDAKVAALRGAGDPYAADVRSIRGSFRAARAGVDTNSPFADVLLGRMRAGEQAALDALDQTAGRANSRRAFDVSRAAFASDMRNFGSDREQGVAEIGAKFDSAQSQLDELGSAPGVGFVRSALRAARESEEYGFNQRFAQNDYASFLSMQGALNVSGMAAQRGGGLAAGAQSIFEGAKQSSNAFADAGKAWESRQAMQVGLNQLTAFKNQIEDKMIGSAGGVSALSDLSGKSTNRQSDEVVNALKVTNQLLADIKTNLGIGQ